jgi:hypothetical protein
MSIVDILGFPAVATVFGVSCLFKAAYTYGTKFNKTITIDEKFNRVEGDEKSTRQIFCISTTDGEVYNVRKSLWYWKFYHTETWNSLKKGQTYNVTGYGWRYGLLSMYPNLIEAKLVSE